MNSSPVCEQGGRANDHVRPHKIMACVPLCPDLGYLTLQAVWAAGTRAGRHFGRQNSKMHRQEEEPATRIQSQQHLRRLYPLVYGYLRVYGSACLGKSSTWHHLLLNRVKTAVLTLVRIGWRGTRDKTGREPQSHQANDHAPRKCGASQEKVATWHIPEGVECLVKTSPEDLTHGGCEGISLASKSIMPSSQYRLFKRC